MVIDEQFLTQLIEHASVNTRKRQVYLLHKSFNAPSQRMLNAMVPGTEVPIHRHSDKEETYAILKGSIIVHFYNNDREAVESNVLSAIGNNRMLVIPQGQWHSVEVLEPSVIFEVCDGPYTHLPKEDIM